VVIPRLETLKNEGQAGQAKITQYTRYLTIGLAILQSTGYIELARSGTLFGGSCNVSVIPDASVFRIATMVITMVAGTAVIMWMGELITDRGIGNGMSVMIFTQVIAVIPGELLTIFQTKKAFTGIPLGARGLRGHRVRGLHGAGAAPHPCAVRQADGGPPDVRRGTSTYIQMKGEPGRRHPRHLRLQPAVYPAARDLAVRQPDAPQGWVSWVQRYLEVGQQQQQPVDHVAVLAAFFVLIVAFTFFYVSITFNPTEVAGQHEEVRRLHPGIRPGRPTAEYLGYVLNRLTTPGSLYLGVVALFPLIALAVIGVGNQFPFSGVSLLIMVGVGLDTVKQIESQLQQRNYEGFLR